MQESKQAVIEVVSSYEKWHVNLAPSRDDTAALFLNTRLNEIL